MRVLKLYTLFLIVAVSVLTLSSCKKHDTSSSPSEPVTPDNCISGRTAGNAIIQGEYIVSYQPAVINARTMSAAGMEQLSARILSDNSNYVRAPS